MSFTLSECYESFCFEKVMFYLYSKPTCLEQKLHNCLARAITFVGKCIGVFHVEKSMKGPYYVTKDGISLLCSYSTNIIAITLCIYVVIFLVILDQNGSNVKVNLYMIGLFGKIARICYWLLVVLFLSTVMFQKESISKIFNCAFELHQLNQLLFRFNQNVSQYKSLLYKFLMKIIFDLTMSSFMLVLAVNELLQSFTISHVVFTTILPISLIIYCFIGTIYYVSLAYALILIQKVNHTLKEAKVEIRNVTNCCHMIVRFVRKFNTTVQLCLLLSITHAFTGFVLQVKNQVLSKRLFIYYIYVTKVHGTLCTIS